MAVPRVMVKTPCSLMKKSGKIPSIPEEEPEYMQSAKLQLEVRQEDFKGYIPQTQENSTYVKTKALIRITEHTTPTHWVHNAKTTE